MRTRNQQTNSGPVFGLVSLIVLGKRTKRIPPLKQSRDRPFGHKSLDYCRANDIKEELVMK